ncbi:hypothetical protein GO491_09830 [Flavobacteriaceae bacterium Ap0902]|nr:hypothetical protein [Flavobacteriaceae bacterium Ap0902]
MKKLLLLIPFLFVLGCSSDDSIIDDIKNPNDSYQVLSFSYDNQNYSESDDDYIHWEVGKNNDIIISQGLYGMLDCTNCDKSSTLKIYFNRVAIKPGDIITDFSAYVTISDFGQFGYPTGDSYVKITKIDSDGSVSGEFFLNELSRLGVGEPRTINITNGLFENLKQDSDL